jgi:hypothetical protein
MLAVGRLFVLLFFVANTGFTVVFSRCTMKEMDCCAASDEQMSDDCSMMDPPQPSSEPSVRAFNDCISVIVVGGLKTDPTVVEMESHARVIKLDLVAPYAPELALSTVSLQFQPISSTASQNVSPPAVEKYVLNSTFLI